MLDVCGLRVGLLNDGRRVFPVDGISFQVARGGLLCIVGESGSGKSMTAYSLMGLLPAGAVVVSGKIRLNGRELSGMSEGEMRKVRGVEAGMVFQEPLTALNPLLTVGNQIAEAMTAHGAGKREARKRALDLLEEAGVRDPARVSDSYPHQLSGGLRQRALIAGALACGPSLLIADEPTTALDVTVSLQILRLMDRLRKSRGMGVLLITHDFGVVKETAGAVAVMYAGVLVETGPANDVLASPRHPYTAALLGALPGRGGREPGSALPVIPGSVPEPASAPNECRFAPRCGRAIPACRLSEPAVVEEDDRSYRCLVPIR